MQSDCFQKDLRYTIFRFDGEQKKSEGKKRGIIYTIWNENKRELYNKNISDLIRATKNEHQVICVPYTRGLSYYSQLEPAVTGLLQMQLNRLVSLIDSIDNIRDTILYM